jgi:hypothetical protein
MLKKPITYTNFDNESVTETFYFQILESELVELEADRPQGLAAYLEAISEANDRKELIAEFKRIILIAYGIKSEDGKRFVKSDQLREEFTQMPAYDVLFMELATDANAAADFLQGALPAKYTQALEQDKPTGPPPTPAPPAPPALPNP